MGQELIDRLTELLGDNKIKLKEPLSKHTTFRIGGVADCIVMPSTDEELSSAIKLIKENNAPYYIMGNGSNILASDEGFRGVIIWLYDSFNEIEFEGKRCTAMAGALLSSIGMQAAKRGLTGFEFATGIPGTVGGAVVMNAGAYGGEIKDCIISARVMDAEGNITELLREQLELSYRHSVVMEKDYIVLSATFEFDYGNTEEIKNKISELAALRRSKQPLEYPSAGSTFKRPEGYFAGKLIEDAGLKGYSVGGAQVSEKHSGFVINKGNATARDVLQLIEYVQKTVYERDGVNLLMEIKLLGDI